MGSASSTMSASPAPILDQSIVNNAKPIPSMTSSLSSTSNGNHGPLKTSSLNNNNSSPIAGPSSKPSSIPKIAPPSSSNTPAKSAAMGTKHKPIIIEEREEGEISEDEIIEIESIPEYIPKRRSSPRNIPSTTMPTPSLSQRISPSHSIPQRGPLPPSAPAGMLLSKNQRKKQEKRARANLFAQSPKFQQNHQKSSVQSPHPSTSKPIPQSAVMPSVEGKGKGKEKEKEREEEAEVSLELNDDVAPAADNMSPEEAEQYIDIIRNLISEGVSPQTLVERGATRKYVMKVCQEIVDGTKKRKALWNETREQPRADSEAPSNPPPVEIENKSPSPEVEIVTTNSSGIPGLERVRSDDSTNSDVNLVERMSIPPIQLKHPSVLSNQHSKQPHPLKVESYQPGQTSHSKIPSSVLNPPQHTGITLPPVSSAVASSSHNMSSNMPVKPIPNQPKRKGKRQRDVAVGPASDVLLNYNEESSNALASSSSLKERLLAANLGSVNPFTILDTVPLTPPFSPPKPSITLNLIPPPEPTSPPPPAPPPLTTEQTLRNTLDEKKRKAMESMYSRRAAVPKPSTTVLESTAETVITTGSTSILDDQAAELQKSIEEQMADIEKEVMEAAAAQQQVEEKVEEQPTQVEEEEQMDIDEPEEGEIMPSAVPTPPLDSIAPVLIGSSSSLPIRPPRGIKRAHAEDLNENRATSIPSARIPPAKRKPFGAAQRLQRLVLNLDDSDSDSDSSDDEREAPNVVFTPNNDVDIIQRQRMLEEKEASIRKLKEQIAARMAARKKKEENTSGAATPMEKTVSGTTVQALHVPSPAKEVETGTDSPLPADVRQLTKELVQAEAEAEAMDVDFYPAVPEPAGKIIEDLHQVSETVEDEHRARSVSPSVIQTTDARETVTVPIPTSISNFSNYRPLLNRYPQLPNSASIPSSIQIVSTASQIAEEAANIDRELLNSIILTRSLQLNPNLVACQAEMGGGKCADRSCQDLHLIKGIIPTDEDLVEYIGQTLSIQQERQYANEQEKRGKVEDALIKAKGELMNGSAMSLETDRGLSALMVKIGQLLKG